MPKRKHKPWQQLELPISLPSETDPPPIMAPPPKTQCLVAAVTEPAPPPVRTLPKTWRFDTCKGFREWLIKLWECGYMHGGTLQDFMIEAVRGSYNIEMADVDDLLTEAEGYGWIVRRELAPTHSQRAFIGLQYSHKAYHGWKNPCNGKTPAQFHSSHWYWQPNRECTEACEWLIRATEAA